MAADGREPLSPRQPGLRHVGRPARGPEAVDRGLRDRGRERGARRQGGRGRHGRQRHAHARRPAGAGEGRRRAGEAARPLSLCDPRPVRRPHGVERQQVGRHLRSGAVVPAAAGVRRRARLGHAALSGQRILPRVRRVQLRRDRARRHDRGGVGRAHQSGRGPERRTAGALGPGEGQRQARGHPHAGGGGRDARVRWRYQDLALPHGQHPRRRLHGQPRRSSAGTSARINLPDGKTALRRSRSIHPPGERRPGAHRWSLVDRIHGRGPPSSGSPGAGRHPYPWPNTRSTSRGRRPACNIRASSSTGSRTSPRLCSSSQRTRSTRTHGSR